MDASPQLSECIKNQNFWMAQNKLKLNDDKSEVIALSSAFSPCQENFYIGDTKDIPCHNLHFGCNFC